MSEKEFKTYDQQLDILESRGLIVENRAAAIEYLSEIGYYCLINEYKDPFINNKLQIETYIEGANFFEIVALYEFDCLFREYLLIDLLRIEKRIRTAIVYSFSKTHGHRHQEYLKTNNFRIDTYDNFLHTIEMLTDLDKKIKNDFMRFNIISHYATRHGYIPLWVLVQVLSFGDVNRLYQNMTLADKQEISKTFNLSANDFGSVLAFMCGFRNKCAHGERIYTYRKDAAKPKSIPTFPLHKALKIVDNAKGVTPGKEDVLALLIAMKLFMKENRYPLLIANLDSSLKNLDTKLSSIKINAITDTMGLIPNWTDLKKIK